MATLYLIPVMMADGPHTRTLPPYNLEVVRRVKYFIVENLRSARRFLKACDRSIDIDTLHFTELSEHTRPEEVASMLDPMAQGHDIGVLSEAGCPAVADPGALAVAEAQRRGMRVEPLVGPSSILLSLMGSGFNGQSFAFRGYLPVAPRQRTRAIRELERRAATDDQTQIFIETPYRNNRMLAELASTLRPDTPLCVASDLTGPRESIVTRNAADWRTSGADYDRVPTVFLIYHP